MPTIGKNFWGESPAGSGWAGDCGGVSWAAERFERGGGLFLFMTMFNASVAEPKAKAG